MIAWVALAPITVHGKYMYIYIIITKKLKIKKLNQKTKSKKLKNKNKKRLYTKHFFDSYPNKSFYFQPDYLNDVLVLNRHPFF
jgi:hypothetical protein